MKKTIFIIDDDLYIVNLLDNFFTRQGYHTHTLTRGKPVVQLMKKEIPDAILCDIRLPDINGSELLQYIRQVSPDTPVIMMTAYAEIRAAVDSMKSGAFDYVTKPVYPEEILEIIKKATSKKPVTEPLVEEFITGKSQQMLQLIGQAKLVAPTDMSVLIQGETGSGKEYIARLIHINSLRYKKKFVAIDCGAIPRELAASELFGHIKGAFTGAISNKIGYFEQANGGTIFLDEIGNLSYDTQVKLLRAIQQKVITRVGDIKPIAIDVRIICASNRNLMQAAGNGHFREDLYHRINEFKVELPALRQRGEDIILFALHFLKQANQQLGKEVRGFDNKVIRAFRSYSWYGNLRELRNVVKRCVLICQGQSIDMECLPEELRIFESHAIEQNKLQKGPPNLKDAAREAEKMVLERALQEANNNKSQAARNLNIDRKTLYNKMDRLGIEKARQPG